MRRQFPCCFFAYCPHDIYKRIDIFSRTECKFPEYKVHKVNSAFKIRSLITCTVSVEHKITVIQRRKDRYRFFCRTVGILPYFILKTIDYVRSRKRHFKFFVRCYFVFEIYCIKKFHIANLPQNKYTFIRFAFTETSPIIVNYNHTYRFFQ